jgi:acetyl esterase/lipase
MSIHRYLSSLCLGMATALAIAPAAAQPAAKADAVIALYPAGIVAALGVPEIRERMGGTDAILIRNVSEPALELFRPVPGRANGTAVIVAPGGGFVGLDYSAGGTAVARRLAQRGVTALVLKYRTIRSASDPMQLPEVHVQEMAALAVRKISGRPVEIPRFAGEALAVEDGRRAVRLVRERAREWQLDPSRIGFLGFSAGAFIGADLAIGDKASRPDFVALLYGGLRTPVPADAPPAFIAGAADDDYLPDDPVYLYNAWRQAGVAAELHVYERGGHGFNLAPKGVTSDQWFDDLDLWMQSRKLMDPSQARSGADLRQP